MPERSGIPERSSDPIDTAALDCHRFWLPRGSFADLSDDGFLVDPESSQAMLVPPSAVPLEALADYSVLGLLGEPGMGKSTVLNREALRLAAIVQQNGDRLLRVDLAACGTDVWVSQRVFGAKEWRSWRKSKAQLYLFLDGFDTCLRYVENLVALLLEGLQDAPRDRLSLRITCRTTDWPPELETELEALWRGQEKAVGIYELAPLQRKDVVVLAEAAACSAAEFLSEVARLGAAQFASRPITLRFLLDLFRSGKGLPQKRTDLYREGCLVLCDEWRDDLRREKRAPSLSSGMRFSVASRLAAVSIFSRKTALWSASRHRITPERDVRIDELSGGKEQFGREVAEIALDDVKETLRSGLFRSVGPYRLAFSHQTYAEFLAAQYLVDHDLDASKMLQLLLCRDGSGRVVSQLRETAAWLAALVPAVCSRILETDPAILFVSDTPPASEEDRRTLVRQILRLFDEGELFDLQPVAAAGKHQDGARIRYAGIDKDLRPFINNKAKRSIARRAAILIAQCTQQVGLEQDLVSAALDDDEPQDVRVAAAVAVRLIGSESSKAALKRLVTIPPSDDPGGELKGAGLAAAWPKYLTADELFDALTSPKKWKPAGEYQRFLASDFAASLRPSDMLRGLQWARTHATRAPGEFDTLSGVALEVVIAAVDCCNDAGVCDCIAEILVESSRMGVPESRLMRKLSSQQDARSSVARAAIRVTQDLWTMRCLRTLGLVEDGDISFLLAELQGAPPSDLQQKIGFLITSILYWGPPVDTDLFEQVLTLARANPVFFAALKPVLGPIELDSEEAKDQQASFKSRRQKGPPPESQVAPNLEDIISAVDYSNVMAFAEIYRRLPRTSWGPDDDALPEWEKLKPDLQAQILRSAEVYLTGHRVADTSWIERGEIWDTVTFGYRALRLLAQVAPESLERLSDDIFNAWMPCVFGDTYTRKVADHAQTAILKAAYLRAPARFRELLSRFIDAQDERSGEIFVLDRLAPVWDNEIAGILRTRLEGGKLRPRSFRSILACLMKAGDAVAARIANDIVASAGEACPALLERSVQVALEVLDQDPASSWQVVWPVARANSAVAESLFGNLAQVPYGPDTNRVLNGLHENDLAELLIWLLQHELRAEGCGEADRDDHRDEPFAMMSANDNWRWLRAMALNNLIQRGTPAATEAIRKLKEAFPNENLDPVEMDSEEFVRKKTWTPLTPSEFLNFVLTPDPSHSVESNSSSQDSPLPPAGAIPINVAAETRTFRKSGDVWNLKFGGKSVLVRSSKGMKYIAELLQCPGKDVHVSQLLGAVEGQGGDLWFGSAGIVLDETARQQYKKRWQELKNQGAKAEHSGDWNRLERIEEEQDQLKGQLASAIGLGGRDRKADDEVERLRKRVSRAISTAIKAIGKHHRQLADHLSSHVEPGQFCSYRGDGIDWQL